MNDLEDANHFVENTRNSLIDIASKLDVSERQDFEECFLDIAYQKWECIETHLNQHNKLHENYLKKESNSRKELDEVSRWEGRDCYILKQLVADDLKYQQDLLKSNKVVVECLQKLLVNIDDVVMDALLTINGLQEADNPKQGLPPARIRQFHQLPADNHQQGLSPSRICQFPADEPLAGEKCTMCQHEVGRRMIRLDCNGQHVFCQQCIEGRFAYHNTCPNCRQVLQ